VDSHGQGLQEGSLFIGKKIRKAVNPVLRDDEEGGKPALPGSVLVTDVLA
jgi:hypothetical protein